MYASELKGVLLRLRPDFNEKAYGCATFGKLLSNLAAKFGDLKIKNDNFNVMVSLNAAEPGCRAAADAGELARGLCGPAQGLQGRAVSTA